MILKQKTDCKLIENNNKYYLYTKNLLYHFGTDYNKALRYFDDIREIEKDSFSRYYCNGKFFLDLYPEDLEIIIHSIECYRFFLTNNRFLDINNETIKNKQFDIDFLANYFYSFILEKNKRERQDE